MLRPVRFVKADEMISAPMRLGDRKETGVEVKVDFVGWEDINQQTAVTSNSGAGPDLIIGFGDALDIDVDKLIELTGIADHLGKPMAAGSRWRRDTASATRATPGSDCRSAPPPAR